MVGRFQRERKLAPSGLGKELGPPAVTGRREVPQPHLSIPQASIPVMSRHYVSRQVCVHQKKREVRFLYRRFFPLCLFLLRATLLASVEPHFVPSLSAFRFTPQDSATSLARCSRGQRAFLPTRRYYRLFPLAGAVEPRTPVKYPFDVNSTPKQIATYPCLSSISRRFPLSASPRPRRRFRSLHDAAARNLLLHRDGPPQCCLPPHESLTQPARHVEPAASLDDGDNSGN